MPFLIRPTERSARLTLCFFLILSLMAAGWPIPGRTAEAPSQALGDPFAGVVDTTLDNGMRVLLLKEPRAPLVTHQVWYRVGSRFETVGKTGLSHLTEHLMFKGTEKYGPKVFSRLVQKSGGNDNAFTSRDYTAYFQTGPASELRRWMEMEADRMRGLKVTEEAFATEQKVVLEERRLRTEDDPVSFLVEEVYAAAYKAHPYQWPIIGWYDDIKSLTLPDFQQYYQTYYQPNNATLVVVGDIDLEATLKDIREVYGALPKGPQPPQPTAREPRQYGERRVWVQREAQLPYVVMVHHVPNWQHPDCFALELLARVLSQGRSSRLYQKLIYTDRLALEAGADYDLDTADPSLFMLYAQPLPGKTSEKVEAALIAEIRRLQQEEVGARELAKVKNQATAAYYQAMDSLFFRGMLLGRLETVARWTLAREFVPKIQAVSAADLKRVAGQYLVPTNRTVGILVPLKTDKPRREGFRPGHEIQ
ncbi:MAG: pitrilysin family protein [Desulfobaccales bacterium]